MTSKNMPIWLHELHDKAVCWIEKNQEYFGLHRTQSGTIEYSSLKVFSEYSVLGRLIIETSDDVSVRYAFSKSIDALRPTSDELLSTVRQVPQSFSLAVSIAQDLGDTQLLADLRKMFDTDFLIKSRERLPIEDIYINSIFSATQRGGYKHLDAAMSRNAAFFDRYPKHLSEETGYYITHGIFFGTNWGRSLACLSAVNVDALGASLTSSFPRWLSDRDYDLCFEVVATLLILSADTRAMQLLGSMEDFERQDLQSESAKFPVAARRYQQVSQRFSDPQYKDFVLTYHIALTIILVGSIEQRLRSISDT